MHVLYITMCENEFHTDILKHFAQMYLLIKLNQINTTTPLVVWGLNNHNVCAVKRRCYCNVGRVSHANKLRHLSYQAYNRPIHSSLRAQWADYTQSPRPLERIWWHASTLPDYTLQLYSLLSVWTILDMY